MGTPFGPKYIPYTYMDPLGMGSCPFTKLFLWIQGWVVNYLEGHGDLINRLITPISHIITPINPIINLLTKSP